MGKFVSAIFIFMALIVMGSCSIDDSNDIEVIKPGDTVIMGKPILKKLHSTATNGI